MHRHIIIYILAAMLMLTDSAVAQTQTPQQVFQTANADYEMGRFDEARRILSENIKTFAGEQQVSAYRLLALCCINQDDIPSAEHYAAGLLTIDPYYTAYMDSPRFTEIIARIKKGKTATITTASQQAETIEEAPVPVTLITEEMLKMIGARTLKEALIAFVPGITDVATNEEMNVALRSVFSSGQEKILILLNGHRLNSYSTNAASLDFSMSLEKVKQIEVLRGPASSIYGGVALTGVVNIITKSGDDVDGLKLKGLTGNYGQIQGDILLGKKYMGVDVLVWASVYNCTGEKYHIMGGPEAQPYALLPVEGDAIIGGYNNKPTVDLGASVQFNKFSFLYNWRMSKSVSSLAVSSGFTPYSYDRYMKWNGNRPGNALNAQHMELLYGDHKGNWSWNAKLFVDLMTQQRLQVGGDTMIDLGEFTMIYPYYSPVGVRAAEGCVQGVSWDEKAIGFKAQGAYDYQLSEKHKGAILFGAEYDYFQLNSSTYFEAINYNQVIKTYYDEKLLYPGEEHSGDIFLQVKHKIGNRFLVNAGARYDFKRRRLGKDIHQLSPRAALVYSTKAVDCKLSYARSFVDAPYFFRSNTLDMEYGDENLKPEILHSIQLSAYSNNKIASGLTIDANLFYNIIDDAIVYNGNAAYNSGRRHTSGVELIARYRMKRLATEVNATYQTAFSGYSDSSEGEREEWDVYNVPEWKFNVVADYELLKGLHVHANANIVTKQNSVFYPLMGELEEITLPARCILNIGARYTYKKLSVTFDVKNLLGTEYTQGGSVVAPIIQPTRWVNASLSLQL